MYVGKFRPPAHVIIFSIVTCGIYALYWYYTIMNDINLVRGREVINPGLFLLLGIFCAPVLYYVLYTVDKNLVEISAEERINYNKENFILWLLLTLVLSVGIFVAMYQITTAYNEIWAERGGFAPR